MADAWATPPTETERASATGVWDTPPTSEERQGVAAVPQTTGMDLGVTEEVPEAPVTAPLRFERAPEQDLLAQARAVSRAVTLGAVEREVAKEEREGDKDRQISALFEAGITRAPDQHTAVLELARKTGIRANIIEQRLPEFRDKAQAASFDARKFRTDNPELAELLLENPQAGPIAFHDKPLSLLTRAMRGAYELWRGEGALEFAPEQAKKSFGMTTAGEPMVPTATGRKVYRGGEWVEQIPMVESELATNPAAAGPRPGDRIQRMLAETFATSQKQVEYSKLGAELMDRRSAIEKGLTIDTWDIEKKIVDLRTELGQRWYDAGPIEQLALDAAEILPSQIQSLKGAGIGGAIGGVVAGGAALVVTRSPAVARAAALKGAGVASRPGVFLASYNQERGSAYLEYLDLKTDDGQPISEATARGAAVVYGIGAAAIETAFFPAALKMLGPAGDAIAAGTGKAYFASLMRDVGARRMLADIGKRWATGAIAEGKEEALQQLLQDFTGYVAKVGTAGALQTPDIRGTLEAATEAGVKATSGTAVLGLGGVGVNVSTQFISAAWARDRAYAAGKQIEALAQVAETSNTARAAPELVAELVRRETEKTGEPITNVYVDAQAFTRLFQAEGPKTDQAAVELMGEDGPQKLKEALAGAHDRKIEVPLADYLDKWGGKQIAQVLAQDTTVRPGLLTIREQIAQDEEIETRRKELLAEYMKENAPAPTSEAERRLVDTVSAQLARTGTYKPKDARKAVALTRAFLRTQAERLGADPDTLFANYALTVQRGMVSARPATALAQEAALKLEPPSQEDQLKERWASMSTEEKQRATFIDPGTGVYNERAFLAQPTSAFVLHLGPEGIKYANKAGHEVGDALYRAAAHAIYSVAPSVSKVKGDFVVPLLATNEAEATEEARVILDGANEAMPAKGFAITGAIGSTLEEAQSANIAQKTAFEKAGKRAKRGRRPKGLRTRSFAEFLREVWKGPPADVVGSHLAAVESTAITDSLKAAFQATPEEQAFRAVYYDPTTGFLSREGFLARPKKAHVVSLDLNKLGDINKLFGKPAGDALLKAFADTARDLGVTDFDFAHFSGDEYAAMSDDPVLLQALIDDLGERCDNVGLQMPDGTILKGITFGYGIGADYATADKAVEAHKRRGVGREREARLDRDRRRGDTDRRSIVGRVKQAIQRGISKGRPEDLGQEPATAIGPRLAQAAYHGSPHRFSRFTLEHMGTGEGAQAFGWGLYFAGQQETGEYYRSKLTAKESDLIKSPLEVRDTLVERLKKTKNDDADAIARRLERYGHTRQSIQAALNTSSRGMIDAIRNLGRSYGINTSDLIGTPGQLYKVDIPEDSELLSYDEPVSEQSPEIQKKLSSLRAEIERRQAEAVATLEGSKEYHEALKEQITGSHIYSFLEQDARENGPLTTEALKVSHSTAEAASRTLLALGIPGLRFLDQGSRAAGQGTHNYVIWDESAIRDLETFYQGERGYVDRMRQGMKKIFKVVLTDKADLSTFLHESAHVFLDVMGDLAARPDANARLTADWGRTLEWLGVKDASEIQAEHHEKWAKAFEVYLREGKAPSLSLVGAFQRFKLWLTQIYRTLAPGDIDDEIRGVFDRMLATDDEIARMKRSMGAERTLFRSPEEAGMSAAEFQTYLEDREKAFARATAQTQRRVLDEKIRATETYLKSERQKALEDAGREYDARPEVVAYRFLKDGQAGDNAALQALLTESGEKIGLNRDAVVATVGDDVTKTTFRGMTEKGGLSPDELAEIVGLPDGETLLKQIVSRPEKITWSQDRSLELLKERSPDILAEQERLKAAAVEALHGEGNSDWLLKEWQALRKRRGESGGPAPLESIRLAARDIIDSTPVGALYPTRVLQAERRAADRAAISAAKGDWKQAALEKQKQVLNHYIHRETTKALEDREKFEKLADKLTDRKRRAALGKAGKIFLDAADTILETLGFAEPTTDPAVLQERKTIPEWMAALEEQGILPAFAGDRLSAILAPDQVDARSISVADMRMIRTALAQLYTAARDINSVMLLGKRVQIDTILANIAQESSHLAPRPLAPASESQASASYRLGQFISGINAVRTDPELMVRTLGETARRFFWDRYIDQRTLEDEISEKVLKFFLEKWEDLPTDIQRNKHDRISADQLATLPYPSDIQRDASLRDRSWMYMLALNVGNRSNLDRLLGGYGWTEDTVRSFLDKNMKSEEWDFVEGVWALLDKELYPQVAAAFEATNGIRPEKIEALPFTLSSGRVITGGYFPARYDPIASRLGESQRTEALSQLYHSKAGQYSITKSFTKERAKTYQDVINLQWNEVPRHIAQVIHYVAFDGYIRDAGRVMAGLQNTVNLRLGQKYYPQLEGWLRAVVSPVADMTPENLQDVMNVLGGIRSRFVLSTLGYSLTVAAGDLTNALVPIASGRIKARFVVPAHAVVIGRWLSMRPALLKMIPELRHRSQQMRMHLRRGLAQIGPEGKKSVFIEGVRDSAWATMEATDAIASTIIAKAAYEQAMAPVKQGGKGMSHEDAVKEAGSQVRAMLPTQDPAEQPTILRDKRGVGSLIAFCGYFLKLYNIKKEVWAPAVQAWMNAETAGEKIATLPTWSRAAGRVMAVTLVAYVLGELLSGRGPEDDEEWGPWAIRKALASPTLNVPVLGQIGEGLVNEAVSAATGQKGMRRPSVRASPALSAVDMMVRAVRKTGSEGTETDEKIFAFLQGLGIFTKIPIGTSQMSRTGRYISSGGLAEDILEGKPIEAAGGLVYGERENQPANPATVIQGMVEGR